MLCALWSDYLFRANDIIRIITDVLQERYLTDVWKSYPLRMDLMSFLQYLDTLGLASPRCLVINQLDNRFIGSPSYWNTPPLLGDKKDVLLTGILWIILKNEQFLNQVFVP